MKKQPRHYAGAVDDSSSTSGKQIADSGVSDTKTSIAKIGLTEIEPRCIL